MKKYPVLFFVIFLACISGASLWAKDIGVILDQSADYSGYGPEDTFDYTGILIPRFSTFLGENGLFYVSAGLNLQNDPWGFVPELLRTELSGRFGNGEIKAGRIQYSDPLGYILDGLFDGAQFSYDTPAGTFSIGAWYTGLLYKKRTNITMTEEELLSSYATLEYDDFADTYFAPRRVVSALNWEHPGLGELLRVNLALLGQFDVSDAEEPLHSQYFAGKLTLPLRSFVFDLGGCAELIELSDEKSVALAGEAGIAWMLPTSFDDRLSLLGRFSSGVVEDSSVTAFLPVTTKEQGEILKAKLSGLSTISLDYTARLHPAFSTIFTSSYFVRSDLGTYQTYGADGYFLGNEFFGRVLWNPATDVQINLGGGVFLPSLGNAAPDAEKLWRIELNLVLALY